jgi:hypothetical protein
MTDDYVKDAEEALNDLLRERRNLLSNFRQAEFGPSSGPRTLLRELQATIEAVEAILKDEQQRQSSVYEKRGLAGFSD